MLMNRPADLGLTFLLRIYDKYYLMYVLDILFTYHVLLN